MKPAADLGWDVTRQAGRPALEMTEDQVRAWAGRIAVLMLTHPRRSAEWWLHELGLSREHAARVLAALDEGGS